MNLKRKTYVLGTASAAILALTAFLTVGGNVAVADECPANQVGVDVTRPGPMAPAGVTDTVISTIDLGGYGSAGHMLRMRRLVVQPGGIVPWHSHGERPAHILVISGSITEYRSSCASPINHPAGDVTAEQGQVSHWWKNNGKTAAVLISADVLPPQKSADGMM